MANYLDFEKKLKMLQDEIISSEIAGNQSVINKAKEKFNKEVKNTFENLSSFQQLQLARHADRPYAMDYVRLLMTDAYEIHGDRHFADDQAIICFIGYIDGQKTMLIGEQKGRGTKFKLKRNFGMPHPEGYRKALRAAKLAEKFKIPILMLIDTPGAYPGLGAEERNQSEAIARNLLELADIDTVTISVVIGEGGSGGALAIGVADRLAMMRYSVFSVISPEGCAAILWNDPKKVETATKALKITSSDLINLGLIDAVIDEPLIGAHRDRDGAAKALGEYFLEEYAKISALSKEDRETQRYERLTSVGSYTEEVKERA
jgi:acetyl-CoA carboxylase carboxyl transferase subunit alpha